MAEDSVPRAGESPKERDRRLRRERARERYASDPDYRERQRAKKRAQYATQIATETPAEKEARLAKQRVANRASYQRHIHQRRARIRQYNAAHPAGTRGGNRRAHRTEKSKANIRRAFEADPAHRRAIGRRSHHKTYPRRKDAINTRRRALRKQYPERFLDANRRIIDQRRARKQHIAINDLSMAQWREVMAVCAYQCVYCTWLFPPWLLTRDHLTPVVDGGNHTVQNILPACLLCNLKKHTGAVLKPVQPFLLTVAPPRKTTPRVSHNDSDEVELRKLALEEQKLALAARNGQEG